MEEELIRELFRDELFEFFKREILKKSDPSVKVLNTLIGSRVIRGPDWKWDKQDGGPGCVGTLVRFKDQDEAVVRWDIGVGANYRCAESYDLKIIDSGPAGIEHTFVMCDACFSKPVFGIRWKCADCQDFDLCSMCYNKDKHDTKHSFRRIDVPGRKGVLVEPRLKCKKVPVRGLFVGARVARGSDWRWESQDGGAGKKGTITAVKSDGENARRGSVVVRWDIGTQNVYRVGLDGKVDLRALDQAKGYSVYTKHLPNVCEPEAEEEEKQKEENKEEQEKEDEGASGFKIGEKVKVELDTETVKCLQEGHGGWNDSMSTNFGQIGEVLAASEGFIFVKFPDGRRWSFNPVVLTKVTDEDVTDAENNNNPSTSRQNSGVMGRLWNVFRKPLISGDPLKEGDIVQVSLDKEKVKRAQENHGGWTGFMSLFLGKIGKVIGVIGDVVRVEFSQGVKFSYNKVVLTKICIPNKGDYVRISDDKAKVERLQDGHGGWSDLMEGVIGKIARVVNVDKDYDVRVKLEDGLKWYLNPLVLTKVTDAAVDISEGSDDEDDVVFGRMWNAMRKSLGIPVTKSKVKFQIGDMVLISSDREMVKSAQEGHGGWSDYMVMVLGELGNVVDITPARDLKVKVGPLNLVFNPDCVSLVSSQSEAKEPVDVPVPENLEEQLFQAASEGDHAIVEVLLALNDVDINKLCEGQTPLHVACQNGHAEVVKLLLAKGADVEKEDVDGDRAVHCAAVSGDGDVIDSLTRACADLNARNAHGQTPMHITVNKGHLSTLRKLLELHCYPSFKDMEGDTPAHDAVSVGRDDMLGLLLKYGADVVMESNIGWNCLHLAALHGNACVLQVLLAKQGHSWYVDGKKCAGAAALHWAVINEHTEAARLLCVMGKANKDVQNHLQQTPLHLAVVNQNAEIVLLLVSEGASLKIQDRDGDTPLHEAIRRHPSGLQSLMDASSSGGDLLTDFGLRGTSSAAIAYFLALNGSDLSIKNQRGKMPLDLCVDLNLVKIISGTTGIAPQKLQVLEAGASQSGHPLCEKCKVNPKDQIFKPCGHVVHCSQCVLMTAKCPICQEVVKSKIKIEECLGCTNQASVQCEPCGHICACSNCAKVGRKCPECRVLITEVVSIWTPTEQQPPSISYQQNKLELSNAEIDLLRGKVQELQEKNICCICQDREMKIALKCGHRFCEECTNVLVDCALCRGPIDDPRKLY